MSRSPFSFDVPPYRLSGSVYGVLLNHRAALEAMGDIALEAPYKGLPVAPVLYIKPRNTLACGTPALVVPTGFTGLEIGASLGLVIGRTSCRVPAAQALDHVAGFTVMMDFSVPHKIFYRPAVRFKALDDSCFIGPTVVAAELVSNPDALQLRVYVDGALSQVASTGGMVRDTARLLEAVTEFMTLSPGDVLMLGVAAGAPIVRAGQHVAVEIDGIGRLETRLLLEAA